jgi:hypothetical protein
VSQVVIENPVINSPFTEPDKHFRFTDEGISVERPTVDSQSPGSCQRLAPTLTLCQI